MFSCRAPTTDAGLRYENAWGRPIVRQAPRRLPQTRGEQASTALRTATTAASPGQLRQTALPPRPSAGHGTDAPGQGQETSAVDVAATFLVAGSQIASGSISIPKSLHLHHFKVRTPCLSHTTAVDNPNPPETLAECSKKIYNNKTMHLSK